MPMTVAAIIATIVIGTWLGSTVAAFAILIAHEWRHRQTHQPRNDGARS
jgi:hypothetical protein